MKIIKPRSTKGTATFAAQIAFEKIASDIVIADLTKIEKSPTDFFVFCSCDSDTQMRAIVSEIKVKTAEYNMQKPRVEGFENSYWIIVDFFDVVMHIMLKEAREFYQIEKIWGDAAFTMMNDEGNIVKLKDFSYLS